MEVAWEEEWEVVDLVVRIQILYLGLYIFGYDF